MKWMEHVLLYEDFEPMGLYEDLEQKIDRMKELKKTYAERASSMTKKSQEASLKAGNFKEKAAKTKDGLSKKIYANRATEEQMSQQLYAAKLKALMMASSINDMKLKTAELKKTQREQKKAGG